MKKLMSALRGYPVTLLGIWFAILTVALGWVISSLRERAKTEAPAPLVTEPPMRDISTICEETAAGIEFFLSLEKRPSASWTRWVVIDGQCYVSNWDELWTCDEAERILSDLRAKHLGAK